jgi:molybdenum cofactor cytidylyltransferase
MNEKISIIILAAGASRRMGSPKQMLEINQKSLLEIAVEAATDSLSNDVVVVLGSNADEHKKAIDRPNLKIVNNENWQSGIGSSIKAGMQNISNEADAVIIMVCDQPLISSTYINKLTQKFRRTGKSVASGYAETFGVPALFIKSQFDDLRNLEPTSGAKKIIQAVGEDQITIVDFPEGTIDLDTQEDYRDFISHSAL